MASFKTTITKSTSPSSLPDLISDTIDSSGTSGDQSQDGAFLLRSSSYASGSDTLYELHVYNMESHDILYLDQDSTTAFTDISISNFTYSGAIYYYVTYLRAGELDFQVLNASGQVVIDETKIGNSADISSVQYDTTGDLVVQYGTDKYATITLGSSHPPVALDDKAVSAWDSDAKVNVLANDTDAESDKLSIASASVTSGKASVTIDHGKLVVHYTGPALDLDETAVVTVKYAVSDGESKDTGKLTVTFDDGYNRIDGTSDDDRLAGTDGRDVIYAKQSTHGTDSAANPNHCDIVNGNGGDDIIFGGGGQNLLFGRDGNDTLYGGNDGSLNQLRGNAGDDKLYGYDGPNDLQGNEGNDWILAGNGADKITGEDGRDTIAGGGGDDLIRGGSNVPFDGRDIIFGGGGNDILYGGVKSDMLSGDYGKDTVNGGDGNDQIFGGNGDDRLIGAFGDDAFYFFKSCDKDTIDYFSRKGKDGVDVLYFDRDLVDSAGHHKPTVTGTSGSSAVIDFGGGDTITLHGTTKDELTGDWYKIGDYEAPKYSDYFG